MFQPCSPIRPGRKQEWRPDAAEDEIGWDTKVQTRASLWSAEPSGAGTAQS